MEVEASTLQTATLQPPSESEHLTSHVPWGLDSGTSAATSALAKTGEGGADEACAPATSAMVDPAANLTARDTEVAQPDCSKDCGQEVGPHACHEILAMRTCSTQAGQDESHAAAVSIPTSPHRRAASVLSRSPVAVTRQPSGAIAAGLSLPVERCAVESTAGCSAESSTGAGWQADGGVPPLGQPNWRHAVCDSFKGQLAQLVSLRRYAERSYADLATATNQIVALETRCKQLEVAWEQLGADEGNIKMRERAISHHQLVLVNWERELVSREASLDLRDADQYAASRLHREETALLEARDAAMLCRHDEELQEVRLEAEQVMAAQVHRAEEQLRLSEAELRKRDQIIHDLRRALQRESRAASVCATGSQPLELGTGARTSPQQAHPSCSLETLRGCAGGIHVGSASEPMASVASTHRTGRAPLAEPLSPLTPMTEGPGDVSELLAACNVYVDNIVSENQKMRGKLLSCRSTLKGPCR